jgi:mono/diheme cytochrome c family protein
LRAAPAGYASGNKQRVSQGLTMTTQHQSRLFHYRRAALLAFLAMVPATLPAGAQDDFAVGRRIFLEKADCQYCHGWAGDGAGQGQSPGGAANLRQSRLDRDSLIMVISCGVPGRAMPHFDDQAYTDKRCYGMSEAELGDKVPPLPPSTSLPRRDIEAVADYLLAKVIGRGEITREECTEALGPRVRSCGDYPAAR